MPAPSWLVATKSTVRFIAGLILRPASRQIGGEGGRVGQGAVAGVRQGQDIQVVVEVEG